MRPAVTFYFDVASPYTYLASTQVQAMAQRCDARVLWRPILLGGLFKATGNSPPGFLPARGRYMLRDLQRWAQRYEIPFRFPSRFPIHTLLAQRALISMEESQPQLVQAAHRVFRAYWTQDSDISSPEVLAPLLGAEALEAASLPGVKEALKQRTAEAVEAGAFGAPSFVLDGELYFGNDRLFFLEAALQERSQAEDPSFHTD